MNLIYLLISMLFLAGCSYHNSPQYVKDARKLTLETAKTLEKEKNLHLCGIGGSMMNDIQFMAMSFDYFGELTLDEGRELIIYATELYLTNINSSEKIRPHLHTYPFTLENVAVRIFCYQKDGYNIPNGKITLISCSDGLIEYKSENATGFDLLHKETFEEALTKLHTNKSSVKESK